MLTISISSLMVRVIIISIIQIERISALHFFFLTSRGKTFVHDILRKNFLQGKF